MKKIILVLLTVLFFSGCSSTPVKIEKSKEIVVKHDIKELISNSKVVEKKLLNYEDFSVMQFKLLDRYKRVLFYEEIKTTTDNKLNFNELNSLLLVTGNTKEYESIYTQENLLFFQIVLKNDERINVLVQGNSSQDIALIYGFSNYEFLKLVKKMKGNSDSRLNRLKYQANTQMEIIR